MVRRLEIEITSILPITILCVCLFVHLLSHIDLNCRFISFNTQLNTLTVSTKKWKPNNVNFYLLLLSYVLIFESYFVIFLSFDFFKVDLDIQRVTKKLVILAKLFHGQIVRPTLCGCVRLGYITILCIYHFLFETLEIWIFAMRLSLCPDIHPNPGPARSNNFAGGFLSFCKWNLNTLSKDDFIRITLLEAHNTEHNYDIISLCETSLDDNVQVPELPGYNFS